jgi:hypothetical protein
MAKAASKMGGPVKLSPNAFNLILQYEVGGGQAYYEKFLQRPTVPGGASGVTIGIGYDLGYNDSVQFMSDWGNRIPMTDFEPLRKCLGLTTSKAVMALATVKHIKIPWAEALGVFEERTIPRFCVMTEHAFPGVGKLPADAYGALVSLVFNRGASMEGSRRIEMRNIRAAVAEGNLLAIARNIRTMKRLWADSNLPGLLKRRDAEADLVAGVYT